MAVGDEAVRDADGRPAIGDAVVQLNMGDKVCSYGFDLGPKQQEQL